jgi:hypothetical protein
MALKFSFVWTRNSSVEYPGLKLASHVLSADLEGEGQYPLRLADIYTDAFISLP